MAEQSALSGMSAEELQRALLLLSTMVKSGGPGQSPIDQYLEEEKKRQEQEKNRQADQQPSQGQFYDQASVGPGGQRSGFQQMMGNLGTANTASETFTGNGIMDWVGKLFSSGSGGSAAAK